MSFQGGQGRPRSRSQEQEQAERAEVDNERKLPRPKKVEQFPKRGKHRHQETRERITNLRRVKTFASMLVFPFSVRNSHIKFVCGYATALSLSVFFSPLPFQGGDFL